MTKKIMKYNPAFLTDEELMQSFIVRHTDLELIIDRINDNITGSNQHILIIGSRGSGKTTLVRRVALEIRHDEVLKNLWYPLIFSEESYEVISAGEFWLESLFHISEQTADERWARTYKELKNESDEKILRERALAQLMDFADIQGKRILLIVENLNMLFEQISDDDEWALRHTLLNEPRIMLLATATHEFEKIQNANHAMFELFKIQDLKPLNRDECGEIWKMITGFETPDNRIRPLEILTGGNPRLLTIISKFGAKLSLKELMDDLIQLVDDHTDYFKSQLDTLPSNERKAYLALAEIWDQATAREIAKIARFDVNKTSSLLNRLVKRGYVSVKEESRKTKWYQVRERLYNIYYLMRRRGAPSNRVKAVVKFMITFYGHDDLICATKMITEEACRLSPERCIDHYFFYEAILKSRPTQEVREKILKSTPSSFFESSKVPSSLKFITDNEILPQTQLINDTYEEPINSSEIIVDKFGDKEEPDIVAKVTRESVNNGINLRRAGKDDEALKIFEVILNTHKDRPEPQIIEQVVRAMLNKGVSLGKLEKSDEEIQTYDELIQAYKDSPELQIAKQVAMAMLIKGLSLNKLEKLDEAIQTYDELIQTYRDRPEPEIAEAVAMAMINKGIFLGKTGCLEEEEEMYRKVVQYKENYILGWEKLISLILGKRSDLQEALQLADSCISKNPKNPKLLNAISWSFYIHGDRTGFAHAEDWVKEALTIAPDNSQYHHTLACILAALNKGEEALSHAYKYLQDTDVVESSIDDAIALFVELSAADHTKEALNILEKSPSIKFLEPLAAGLKLFIEKDIKAAAEIMEVAKDIVIKIKERQEKRKK